MAQVALADSLQLPPDSSGKRTGMFKVNLAGTDVYLPASVLTDISGNAFDSATSAPAGTERGLIVRNVPSGTQAVSGTVTANAGTGPFVAAGDVAHDGVDSGNPVKVGGKATPGTPASVASGDRVDAHFDVQGKIGAWIGSKGASDVVAVKAASTAPVATDPSLVVALSPNTGALTLGAGAATVGTVLNVGDVDHDAVNTGKVVQTGGHASPQDTPPTAVSAAADRVRQWLDLNGAMIIRPRKVATYRATFRAGALAAPASLSKAFTAGQRFQFATIHHAATATKTVKLRRVLVSVAGGPSTVMWVDLLRISTAPATSNPAITIAQHNSADSAAEVTVLALPTTNATEGAVLNNLEFSTGVTGGGTTLNPIPVIPWVELYAGTPGDDEAKPPTIRAGVLEGYAVSIYSAAAATVTAQVMIEWTEE